MGSQRLPRTDPGGKHSIFDLVVVGAGEAAPRGQLRTWRGRLPAPSLKYLSAPLRPQTLPRTRKRENYMFQFADLAEINPPRKARLEMPGPIAPGCACRGSTLSPAVPAAPAPGLPRSQGEAGKLPPTLLGVAEGQADPVKPRGWIAPWAKSSRIKRGRKSGTGMHMGWPLM